MEIKKSIDKILNRHPAVGIAIGVIRDGRLEHFSGHGLADIASKTPITEDTVFRIGSITKTFTAVAVMQLQERGLVDLDAPASGYLRAFRLIPASPEFRPVTLRHLLTHTAGIREVLHPSGLLRPLFGEAIRAGRRVPSPAEYYRGGLPVDAEPGSRFIYTDHDFATVGQIVEDVSGEPFDRYLRTHVFDPLGMTSTDLVRSDRVRSRLATGYKLRKNGPDAIRDYELVTAAGGGAYSTSRDMGRYIAALIGGGGNEHGSVLKPETLACMFEPQYQPDPRVPGLGLAFSRFDLGGHLAVEHGGVVPGFNSQIFVAPADRIGVMAFTNGAPGAMFWMPAEMGALLVELLGLPEQGIRRDVPQHPELWAGLCGRYRVSARLTDARTRMSIGAGAQVFVHGGRLMVRGLSPVPALYRGFVLHPDSDEDPHVFRIDLTAFGMGTGRVVFSQNSRGETDRIHFELFPLSLQKVGSASPSRFATLTTERDANHEVDIVR